MKVYMMVTRDKYELPVLVCNTIYELSNKTGASIDTIRSIISKKKTGKQRFAKFVEVEVDEEDAEV